MKKVFTLIMTVCLAAGLAACAGSGKADTSSASSKEASSASVTEAASAAEPSKEEVKSTSDSKTEKEATSEEESSFDGDDVNIAVLSGPTGVGAVYLMEENEQGDTINNYNFTVASANDEIVAGISSGSYDIAAAATNVAANLYSKLDGKVQICALNTYGVLYILENGESINSVSDLAGKTIYATGQGANPEYVLKYILEKNGISDDVNVEFMDAESLTAGMASGEYEICMLPMPAAAAVQVKNQDVRIALDLTEEWNKVSEEGSLTMGCVIVRTEFANEHKEAVNTFLDEYERSINNAINDNDGAAELCEKYGIVAKAAIAKKALPYCALCCITGSEIQSVIEPYYSVLYGFNPSSIGGAIPDEGFYYTGK